MRNIFLLITTILLQGCSVFGIRTGEILNYQVLEKEGKFDIRQYEDYWVVRTEIDDEYRESTGKGFQLLFGYISGKNKQQEKIAMNGPVIQKKVGKIWIMEFVLPSKYNTIQPPEPLDTNVSILKVPGYRAAAISYSGNLREEKYNTKIKKLLDIVELKGLQSIGEPFSAGYDPPWTIPFLKRNEVLIIVD